MRGKINMNLSFCQAENGYSLDELVQKLAVFPAARTDPVKAGSRQLMSPNCLKENYTRFRIMQPSEP